MRDSESCEWAGRSLSFPLSNFQAKVTIQTGMCLNRVCGRLSLLAPAGLAEAVQKVQWTQKYTNELPSEGDPRQCVVDECRELQRNGGHPDTNNVF